MATIARMIASAAGSPMSRRRMGPSMRAILNTVTTQEYQWSIWHVTSAAARRQHGSVAITPDSVRLDDPVRWGDFSGLLQRGVFCPIAARCSVGDFLTGQLGIDPDYVRDRIATVFLDGSVVDDLAAATVWPGSTLTLSAAMPGLVGATLRRSGFYAAMRSEISWKLEGGAVSEGREGDAPPGTVRLKLFNTVLREIGPALLRRGVMVDRVEATATLRAWCSDAGDASGDATDDPGARWVSLRVTAP